MGFKKNSNKPRLNYILFAAIFILCIAKQHLIHDLPVLAIPDSIYDDKLLVTKAISIFEGDWLGTYGVYTFTKGCFFPVFLAFSRMIGIPYIYFATAIYSIACVIFIVAIKPVLKSPVLRFVVFVVLLFNPASYSPSILLRLYSIYLPVAQTVWVIGCYIGLYLRRYEKPSNLIWWGFLGGVGLSTMLLTRDDAMWIYPFIIVLSIIYVISLIIFLFDYENKEKLKTIIRVCAIVVPIIVVIIGNQIVASVNDEYYGMPIVNEASNTYYSKVIKLLKTIEDTTSSSDIPYVSVSRAKLKQLYKYSSTLKSIEKEMNDELDMWTLQDRNNQDEEVEEGFFSWALHEAVERAGYYEDAEKAENFYKDVYDELMKAVDKEKISLSKYSNVPIFNTWRKGYFLDLMDAFQQSIVYTISLKDISMDNVDGLKSADDKANSKTNSIDEFVDIANGYAIYPGTSVSGWYVNFEDDDDNLTLELVGKARKDITEIEWIDSTDIYNAFDEAGLASDSFKKCRFLFHMDYKQAPENYKLVITNSDGDKLDTIPLTSKVEDTPISRDDDEASKYHFDYISTPLNSDRIEENTENIEKASRALSYIKVPIKIYQIITIPAVIIALICYLYLTFYMMVSMVGEKKNAYININYWLILTGIMLSYFVILIGISYIHITACNAILVTYFTAAYPLIYCFIALSITMTINQIIESSLESAGDRYRKNYSYNEKKTIVNEKIAPSDTSKVIYNNIPEFEPDKVKKDNLDNQKLNSDELDMKEIKKRDSYEQLEDDNLK